MKKHSSTGKNYTTADPSEHKEHQKHQHSDYEEHKHEDHEDHAHHIAGYWNDL